MWNQSELYRKHRKIMSIIKTKYDCDKDCRGIFLGDTGFFNVNSGARPGDFLSPSLFSMEFDFMMKKFDPARSAIED